MRQETNGEAVDEALDVDEAEAVDEAVPLSFATHHYDSFGSGISTAANLLLPVVTDPESSSFTLSDRPRCEICDNSVLRNQLETLNLARRYIYVSHVFAQFSEVAWQFSLILFLAAATGYQSLFLVSSYGLVSGLAICSFGSTAGKYVDSANRLASAQFFIWTENVSVLVATLLSYLLLSITSYKGVYNFEEESSLIHESDSNSWLVRILPQHIPRDGMSVFCLLGIHLFGSLAAILDSGFVVAIERVWIVIMSQSAVSKSEPSSSTAEDASATTLPSIRFCKDHRIYSEQHIWLSETNVAMKQIDLTCKVIAPAISGFIVGAFDRKHSQVNDNGRHLSSSDYHNVSDLSGAAVLVGVVNVAALIVEYYCTQKVYHMIPALALKEHATVPPTSSPRAVSFQNTRSCPGLFSLKLPTSLRIYLDQPVAYAGVPMALLYLNSLTFGGLMTAYLIWRGMRLETVGIWRGASAAIGLVGTVVYYWSVRRYTVVTTGMWSILYQLGFVTLALVSLFLPSYTVSMTLLIAGVCASRVGLWAFDIAVTQLMQEYVPYGIRGVVGGTQESLNAMFQLMSFGLGLIFPSPSEFYIYVAAGYSALLLACVLYYWGVFRKANDFLMHSEV